MIFNNFVIRVTNNGYYINIMHPSFSRDTKESVTNSISFVKYGSTYYSNFYKYRSICLPRNFITRWFYEENDKISTCGSEYEHIKELNNTIKDILE
jgi:hypothetical protein